VHHSYLDKYARQESALHQLKARTKLLPALATIILIAVVPQPGIVFVAILIGLIIGLCVAAGIPLDYLLLRSAVVLPFSLFAALSLAFNANFAGTVWQWGPLALTAQGLNRAAALLLRSWLAVSLMIILINTTPFDRILRALRLLRIPELFVLLLSFFYRYLYLLWDERERMQRARDLRYFGGRWKQQCALAGHLASALFLRSYERAERVQKAMLARGWDGKTNFTARDTLPMQDWLVLIGGAIFLTFLWLIRRY